MLRKRHAVAISEIHLLDQWFAGFLCKRGKSVGKRVQHTPPTGTTLTEFRRFLNTDFGTLRMNAKSTHTFAPLTFLWGKISEKDGVCCTRRKGENP
jgi:hypothetical protein